MADAGGVMKKLLLIVVCLVVVVIGAALALPFLIPTETYKAQIEARVEQATGRALRIEGPLEFSLLPSVALSADNVRFANAPGGTADDMAQLKALQIELKVWPLLRGALEVDRFVLVEPQIHLEVDDAGQPNWQFATAETEPAAGGDGGGGDGAGGGSGGGRSLPISEIKLGDIRIENGTLTYDDASSGTSEKVEAINLTLDLPDLQSRLQAAGSLAYKGQKIDLDLGVDHPLAVVQGGASPLSLAVDSALLRVGFDGEVRNDATPGAVGGLELSVTSIRELAAWLAEPIQFEGEGLQKLTIKGQLDGAPTRVAFTDATIGLDAIEGQGEVIADLGGAVPKLSGRLGSRHGRSRSVPGAGVGSGGLDRGRTTDRRRWRRAGGHGRRRTGRPSAGADGRAGPGRGRRMVGRADRAAAARRCGGRFRADARRADDARTRARPDGAGADDAGQDARGGAEGVRAV